MSVGTDIDHKPQAQNQPFAPSSDIPQSDVWRAIQYVKDWFDALVPSAGAAPKNAQYLVATADSTLTAERVTTDTATVAWDHATAAQAKANVPDDAITDAKLRNSAAVSVIGRSANSAGDPADIAASANDTLLRRVSDAVGFGALTLGMAAANLWTFAKLQQIAGLSVPGVTGSSMADMAAITAANDGEVLRRSGTSLAFGTVATAGIADNQVTDAKLRDSAAVSVIGRSANSSGDPADIAAGANDTLLRRVSDALSFGALTLGMAGANLWTYAKLQQVSATSRFLGRITAGAGDIEELTGTQATSLLDNVVGDSGSGGTKGLVPAPAAGDAAAGKFLKADGTFAAPTTGAVGVIFSAYNSAIDTNVTGDNTTATVDFDTEIFDLGNNFAADTFTAPSTGKYRLSGCVLIQEVAAGHTTGRVDVVTSNRNYRAIQTNVGAVRDANNFTSLPFNVVADMDIGDTAHITVTVTNSTKVVDVYGDTSPFTFFQGELIG